LPKKVLGLKIKDFDKNLNEIKVCCGSIWRKHYLIVAFSVDFI
jgi:hypothetical protein